MRKPSTKQRERVLEFVVSHLDENSYPPTYEEIKEAVGLSSRAHVDYYLRSLEEDGVIQRTPRTSRGICVVGREAGGSLAASEVKVEGTIAAGVPLELADRLDCSLDLGPELADPKKDLYALQVQGDSMVDEFIADGDLLIVERQEEARRGHTAVVHLQDRNEATLKRVFPEGDRVRLQPAHPSMPSIYADARDVRVQGRVVAVIRQL
jgi:repressor LexA